MPKTEAEKKANKKYLEKLDVIYLRLTPEEKEQISSYAKSKGESVNSFVIRAVKEVMGKKVGQSTLKNRKTPWNSKGFCICSDYSNSMVAGGLPVQS